MTDVVCNDGHSHVKWRRLLQLVTQVAASPYGDNQNNSRGQKPELIPKLPNRSTHAGVVLLDEKKFVVDDELSILMSLL